MTDSQAIQLNEIISKENPAVLAMLSERGKNIFFPKLGILSQAAQAKGKDINATIGQAMTDEGKPMHLEGFDTLTNMEVEHMYPYAPSYGKPDLRAKWKEFLYEKNPSLADTQISLPIATNGLTHAISMAAYMFVEEGDSVISPDLYWENYDLIFKNSYKADIATFSLFAQGKFNVDGFSHALKHATGPRKIVLLNFPNNPTGYSPSLDEIMEIKKVILEEAEAGNTVTVLIDDAYFGLVYKDEVYTESIFTQLANVHENVLAVKIDGPTKEDYVWGFRVGFITYGIKNASAKLYETLEAKTAGALRGNISNISNLSQSLLMKIYQSDKYMSYKQDKYNTLAARFAELESVLEEYADNEFFEPLPFNAGYFMCIQLKNGLEGEKIRQVLLEKYSTGVIVFGNVIRLAFSAVPQKSIRKLVENIVAACTESK
ncbi:MAG: aminotransferase class I/II-fold pyridoxal phosphate-dependent enzyme [Bacteroidales bacterium]